MAKKIRKDYGINVFAVGAGRYFDGKELDKMASPPLKEHVFTADFKHVQYIISDMQKAICKKGQSVYLCYLGIII